MVQRLKSAIRAGLWELGYEVISLRTADGGGYIDARETVKTAQELGLSVRDYLAIIQCYLLGGQVPWSPGYTEFTKQFIIQKLNDPTTIDLLRRGETLPTGYGIGIHERCIEYPWLFAHLGEDPKVLLDAGSVLNQDYLLDHPFLRSKRIHILALAPEDRCFWQRGISYLFDDLRQIPIRDEYYDTIVCLSTLEHVGCDNTLYSGRDIHRENNPGDHIQVMCELRRVLKPGGQLYLSVPFGAYRHFGAFQQFDSKELRRAVEAFGKATERTWFYRYTEHGWDVATAEDCASSEYVDWVGRACSDGRLPKPLPCEPDRAAAARAVACVKLTKL